MDAAEVAGQTFYFELIDLFPETFKNRPNGLQKGIAEACYDVKPKLLRFPGGTLSSHLPAPYQYSVKPRLATIPISRQ